MPVRTLMAEGNGWRVLQVANRYSLGNLLVAILGTATFFCFACRDKGVEPNSVPRDYKVYFSSETAGSHKLFTFHTGTLEVDSADLPWGSFGGVTVSADGKRLYINTAVTVHVVDAATLSPVAELPYRSFEPVAVSPDNRLVAITGDDLTILRTSDYSVLFSDTNETYGGAFSSDNKMFFCPALPSSHSLAVVYSVDLSRRPYRVTRKGFNGHVVEVVPSHDQSKWFVYSNTSSWSSLFEVYDVDSDSVVFRDVLTPGFGHLALTPDDRYVFYTNPGRGIGAPPPSGFLVYDVRTNSSTAIIDTDFFRGGDDSTGWWKSAPAYLTVTPDGRWLVMMSGLMTGQVIYLWDIPADRPVFRWRGFPRQFYNLSTQPDFRSHFR